MAASMKVVGCFLSKRNAAFRGCVMSKWRNQSTDVQTEVSNEVQYPEIKGKYPPGRWSEDIPRNTIWNYYKRGQSLLERPDIRARLEEMAGTDPKYMFLIRKWDPNPKNLEFHQSITRTHIVKKLPDIYDTMDIDNQYNSVKQLIIDAILKEYEYQYRPLVSKGSTKRFGEKTFRSKKLLDSMMNSIFTACAHKHSHLFKAQVDRDVRVETFWRVSGFSDFQTKGKWFDRLEFQYKDVSSQQIRTVDPLPEIVPHDDKLCLEGEYPSFHYSPITVGQKFIKERPITVSGHWIGDPCEYIHTSIQVLEEMHHDFCEQYQDKPALIDEMIVQTGLITSFASCTAMAHNMGFNHYHDVTYPFTIQTIVSDGKFLQPFTYQLNTIHLWQTPEANNRNNILWVGPRLQMYDSIQDGDVKGFNDEAFRHLVRFLVLQPGDRGYNLRPYCSEQNAPANKTMYINHKGAPVLEKEKIGRWQYPRNSVYF